MFSTSIEIVFQTNVFIVQASIEMNSKMYHIWIVIEINTEHKCATMRSTESNTEKRWHKNITLDEAMRKKRTISLYFGKRDHNLKMMKIAEWKKQSVCIFMKLNEISQYVCFLFVSFFFFSFLYLHKLSKYSYMLHHCTRVMSKFAR